VLLSFVLVYVLFVLRDVSKITETTKDTAEKINTFVMQPIRITKEVAKYAKPFVSIVEKRVRSAASEAKAKKKKPTSKKKSS
jgi:hypothetical protein